MMDGLISRRLAIKTALEFFVEFFGGAFREDDQRLLAERIEALPSAQPERKTGRWIRSSNKLVPYYCSSCTGRFDYEWKFCPKCGAKMENDL